MGNFGYENNMIITTQQQYNELLDRMNRDECVLTPIFRDPYYHQAENSVLCATVTFSNLDTYTVSISHDDAPSFEIPYGIKVFSETDIHILAYVNNQPIPQKKFSTYVNNTYQQFSVMKDTNKLIPLMVWSKTLREYHLELITLLNTYHRSLNDSAFLFVKQLADTLKKIEMAGLKVNTEILHQFYDSRIKRYFKQNMVYTEYNLFTTTGRPSNRFGGINFSAINKSNGSREAFVSRYTDGVLVQFDFEAYHLRLIADEHNIELPTGSLHTELAKKYFDTDDITDELYAASKQKTFEIMYGMSDETYGIELFERIVNIRRLFKEVTGQFILPSGILTELHEPNSSKLFNYHVQSLEVVKTLPKLQQVLELLDGTSNHLILYTYDSILLDMQALDKSIIQKVADILEENKKFPVRIHMGQTYDDMTEISVN